MTIEELQKWIQNQHDWPVQYKHYQDTDFQLGWDVGWASALEAILRKIKE